MKSSLNIYDLLFSHFISILMSFTYHSFAGTYPKNRVSRGGYARTPAARSTIEIPWRILYKFLTKNTELTALYPTHSPIRTTNTNASIALRDARNFPFHSTNCTGVSSTTPANRACNAKHWHAFPTSSKTVTTTVACMANDNPGVAAILINEVHERMSSAPSSMVLAHTSVMTGSWVAWYLWHTTGRGVVTWMRAI